MSNCFIETGDDAIIIRANNKSLRENKVCERVVVTNCTLHSWSCGVRLAWCNDGIVRNCTLSNLVIFDSCRGIGCELPRLPKVNNDYGREPTLVENISFDNIQMDEIYGNPIHFMVGKDSDILFAGFRNITFSNINCRKAAGPVYITGREDAPAENFTFNNCYFEQVSPDSLPIQFDRHGFPYVKAAGDEVNLKNIVYNNTRFERK